ncbi:uncharacterized protein LOC117298037 isoform X1 [Asterias rubens]|uniref:uncharacterized protein LOC117298037 isoform X1 n=1 Tax=Asterias rubens TaxID=7604 RepID=UPI0014558A7E|nr:uncharacterized protein LOC117298037 isoform X1 [Asterias rubens]XP_033637154.1 uncharacterized protein LOC117298037 isoform X2 [Asterias rubens]XP_033637155.1 uncharacterized protein LOC117298037 isoform X1 [Asterias rubens]XP_033637156.1 uncharacterized protein LOC117298037 isoform X1 [Asterias rubens]
MCSLPVITAGPNPSFCLFLFLVCLLSIKNTTSETYVTKKTIRLDTGSATENFNENEKFKDMFELTEDNFEEMVLDTEDPWIVLFTGGMLQKEWKTLAVSLRGVVWFGILNRLAQEDLLEEIDFNVRKNPPARVYPYGGTKQKGKWVDVQSAKEAERIAVYSLPDISKTIDLKEMNQFIYDSYLMLPPCFPAVFVIGNEMPARFKSIALHYNRYFHFGVVRNPTSVDLENLSYDLAIPGLLALVSEDYGDDVDTEEAWRENDYKFQSIGFTAERQGELNYPNLVRFLYSINIQFRHSLPGNNMADDKDVLTMDDVMEVEGQRFNVRYMEELRNIKGSEIVSRKDEKQHAEKSEL